MTEKPKFKQHPRTNIHGNSVWPGEYGTIVGVPAPKRNLLGRRVVGMGGGTLKLFLDEERTWTVLPAAVTETLHIHCYTRRSEPNGTPSNNIQPSVLA